jgi:4-hydroxythreonine-4-phosphate dehydrogenase
MGRHLPRIGLTLGDPAGIGPELVLRALAADELRREARLVAYGSAALLRRVADAAGIPWPAGPELHDLPFAGANAVVPGRVQAACGRAAADWVAAAARDALAGGLDAIVTAPLNKEALHLAGVPFPGHTEMLASLGGARRTAMLFWSPSLIVSLATIHLPLADVPAALTTAGLLDTLRLTADACRRLGRTGPLGVLALNPHAGEGGLFGREEQAVIAPAIATARAEGLAVEGPLVPDTAFLEQKRGRYAAYVAMHHDQGLIPFKMLAFAEGVNVTLGLPFVRTSPDHGTAFDLAWQNRADPSSFFSAIRCACRLAAPAAT